MRVQPLPMSVVVDLVNGWGTQPRTSAGEQGLAFPPTVEVVSAMRPLEPAHAGTTDKHLQHVADRLYPVFATDDPAVRADRLRRVLVETDVRPTAYGVDDVVEVGWNIPRRRDAIAAAAALTLLEHLGAHRRSSLGTCVGDRCTDVYADSSPGQNRRFCSVTCQNRARVGAFRARRRTSERR